MTRIGISIGTTFSTDGPGGHRDGPRMVLGQARAAARAGLDTLSVGDHHATGPAGYVQNVPVIGRILGEWHGAPVGCLFLVPLWHPVLMAEQIGTLAAMAPGPFIVQVGGGGRAQFAAMGADLGDRGARMEEGIRVVRELLAGGTADSDRYGIRGARIAPLPPEGTEWWIGGGVPKSIDRAARLGDCWYGNADLTPQTAARDIAIYREALARHDAGEPVRIPIRKDVFISEDRRGAEKVGDALVAAGYRGFDRSAVAYGDPDSVAEQLAVYPDLGFTDIIIRTMAPLPAELGPDAADRSVELAAEVRARLQK